MVEAAKRYGDRIIAVLIGSIISSLITWSSAVYVMIPDLNQRIDDGQQQMEIFILRHALKDSVNKREHERIMAMLMRHEIYLNGAESGEPGIRTEVYTYGVAIGDIRKEIDDLWIRVNR
jgi:hypothetical protein